MLAATFQEYRDMATRSGSGAKDEDDKPDAAPADEKLVEEAVSFIRKTLADTVYRGAVSVGEFVLERFFGDDLDPPRALVAA